jgi:hypothetical protein
MVSEMIDDVEQIPDEAANKAKVHGGYDALKKSLNTVNRPDKIRVGPIEYDIEWYGEADKRALNYAIGQFDGHMGIIRIAECLKPKHMACVFVHEVVHAVHWWIHSTTDDDQNVSEETSCNAAGYGLTDVWLDNPEVFAWWCSLVKG